MCEDYFDDTPWDTGTKADARRRYFETMDENVILPVRSTGGAAGYDLRSTEKAIVAPGTIVKLRTGVRAKIPAGEVLIISVRSSLAARGVILANGIGVIDSDYYGNESNGGEIIVILGNIGGQSVFISPGERIAQGIFMPFFIVDDDTASVTRIGGIGSTGQ